MTDTTYRETVPGEYGGRKAWARIGYLNDRGVTGLKHQPASDRERKAGTLITYTMTQETADALAKYEAMPEDERRRFNEIQKAEAEAVAAYLSQVNAVGSVEADKAGKHKNDNEIDYDDVTATPAIREAAKRLIENCKADLAKQDYDGKFSGFGWNELETWALAKLMEQELA